MSQFPNFASAAKRRLGQPESAFAAAMKKRKAAEVEKQLPGGDVGVERGMLEIGRTVGAGIMELAGDEFGPVSDYVGQTVVLGKSPEGTLDEAVDASIKQRMAEAQEQTFPDVTQVVTGTVASIVAAKLRGVGMATSLGAREGDRNLEAFARGLQQSTQTYADDPVTNMISAVTQGPVSLAEFMALPGPVASASFFLQGAGAGAFEYEEAAKAGETEFSRPMQYVAGGIQGAIETGTEMIGGAVEAKIAKTTAGQILAKGIGARGAGTRIAAALTRAYFTEAVEEGAASLGTNYLR